jgi:hypothetical protein
MPEEQPTATETSKKVLKTFSLEECNKHTTEQSCWLIIHGKVYDVTDFLEEHPGGYDIVVSSAGASLGTRLCRRRCGAVVTCGHHNTCRNIASACGAV